jgi:hypothetical protein
MIQRILPYLDTFKTGALVVTSWILSLLTWEVAGQALGILLGCSSLTLTWCWIRYVIKKTYYMDLDHRRERWGEDDGDE